MLTDIDKEFETPEIDENGELIEVIEEDDVFIEEDTGLEEQPDSFYEDIEDDIVQEGEEEEELDNIQEVTVEAKENYENAKEQLVAIFLDILERGEITPEDNIEIEQVKEQYSEAYNSIKENTEVIQKKTLEERVQELADGMVGATTDEILNILTDDGRKPWLYKNEDNDVLVDMTAIPELTVLINKLFLIATDGENEGEFQLTPDFIKMIVGGTGSGNAIDKIINKYYLSTSKIELIGSTWGDDIPDPAEQEGKFLWIKTVTTFLDKDKKPQETTPICISAQDGSDGTNGKTSYFHIKYSPVPNPTVSQMSETPSTYIGTYVDFSPSDSTDPAKYTWSRFEGIQGSKGDQGIPGTNGANGKTTYLHIKYSNDEGKTFTANNGETVGYYIGTCTDFNVNDPTIVSAYTWTKVKGDKGDQGIPGQNGVSVEEVIIQYSKGTSTSTAPADGWDTSMPSYQEGYFLWIRTRIKYSNKSDYVYSTPTCDQSWKANQEVYTQYKQLKEKFSWIVKSGTSESNMELTDALFKVLTETISLTAKNINLDGYVSNSGGNFAIDEQGNAKVNDLWVKGEFRCDSLSVESLIHNPRYPEALYSSMNIYVDALKGHDDTNLEDGATFKTLSGALESIPKNLNGKTVNIQLNSDITESVSMDWFMGGRIRLFFGGHTMHGTYTVYRSYCMHEIFGGTIDNRDGDVGSMMPYVGKNAASISATMLCAGSPDVTMYNIEIYEAKTLADGCSESAGVSCSSGFIYTKGITIVGCDYGFRTNSNGIIYDDSSTGHVSSYGFIAVTGGEIKLSNGKHTGGKIGNTYENSGGTIKKHSATFDGTTSTDSNTSTTPTVTTKKVTYTSSGGDTWRTTYDSWRKENIVIEGNGYGSGNCRGYWFFGSQLGQIKGCEVLTVVLKVKRAQIGAWSSKSTIKLVYHNYLSRPSSPDAPTYFASVEIGAYSGDYVSINITNSTVLKGIKEGTIKGFGLYDSSYGTYVGYSSSAKVEITYKE